MAKPPRIGPRCRPRDPNDPLNWVGCEAVARRIQALIGGEIKTIRPKREFAGLSLGQYRGIASGWIYHEVVLRDDRVFDACTGHQGLPIVEYKALWEAAEDLDFGF
jgi:hypothetical protein